MRFSCSKTLKLQFMFNGFGVWRTSSCSSGNLARKLSPWVGKLIELRGLSLPYKELKLILGWCGGGSCVDMGLGYGSELERERERERSEGGGDGRGRRGGRRRKGEEEIDNRGRVGEMEWEGGEREDEEGKRGLGSSGPDLDPPDPRLFLEPQPGDLRPNAFFILPAATEVRDLCNASELLSELACWVGETKARVLESIEPLSFVDAFKNSRVRNGQQHQTQNR
ncbi:Hypothetical predicted protein [Prunus dulcis]|uniref:Uncharacterized protein n=1 Tax=Prunus dulcis TaxID=3755 RepID=A0A5E4FX84_PRUDU|nr:Hypothetical predicted protein [Prunus dulcis]